MTLKRWNIMRGAVLIADIERIDVDILKMKNGQFNGQIWDPVISNYVPAADIPHARTTDERAAEILRSGIIADLEKQRLAMAEELDELSAASLRPITIVQAPETAAAMDEPQADKAAAALHGRKL